MDLGLFIIRVVVGLLMAAHGTQKLLGWFGGKGLAPTAAWFGSIGFHPGRTMAVIASATEIGAGLLFAIGLLTPLAAAGITGTLVVAMYTHRDHGLWNANGGFELALLYTAVAVGVALTGAGRYSLDHALDVPHVTDTGLAGVVIAISVVLSLAVILRARLGETRSAQARSARTRLKEDPHA